MSEDLVEAAVQLAKEGIAVFPVGLDKRPRNRNGFHGATTDEKQVRAWDWNGGGAIGAAIPDGHFIVDIDPRNGGDQTVKALLMVKRTFPGTRTVETQSGGTHRYYKMPEGMDASKLKGTLGPGVDIKASGKGYVLVPPSPGYELKWDSPIAEAPEWMLEEIVVAPVDPSTYAASEPKYFPFERGTKYGLAAMEFELENLANAGEGGRNNALNRAAFSLAQLTAGGELSEESAILRLEDMGEKIGLDLMEIRQTIKSGWSAGLEEPRQAPANEETREDIAPEFSSEDGFWTDYQNIEDHGPPEYYLFPIVPKNAYLLVYGPTEASKSMVFMALAAQASHQGIKSSIYSLENPTHIDVDRIHRWRPNPENLRISHQLLDMSDPRQLEALVSREAAWDTDWVILDTYSHAFYSKSDDGNAKAIQFAKIIRNVLKRVDCTVIVVDHTGYSAHGEPRDASAKRQAVDMSIKMERAVPWKPNQPSVFRMDNTKSARFGNPFELIGRIKDVPGARDLELEWDRQYEKPRWHSNV